MKIKVRKYFLSIRLANVNFPIFLQNLSDFPMTWSENGPYRGYLEGRKDMESGSQYSL